MSWLANLFGGHPEPATFHELAAPVEVAGVAYDAVYQYPGEAPGLGTIQEWGVQTPGWARVDNEDIPVEHAPPADWRDHVARSWSE